VEERSGVPIRINDVPIVAPEAVMTGANIAALGGFPTGNQLFLELPGPEADDPIRPDQRVELRPHMKFYDVPVGNFG
jgi:hypothetical protein